MTGRMERIVAAIEKKIPENSTLVPFAIAGFGMACCLIITFAVLMYFVFGVDLHLVTMSHRASAQYWGQIGDFFGGVLNPLLSFSALIAVVLSLMSQAKSVDAARKEADAAIKMQLEQTSVFQQQNFESVFFGLIQLHIKNLDRVKAPREAQHFDQGDEFSNIVAMYNFDKIDDGIDMKQPRGLGRIQYQQNQIIQYSDLFVGKLGNALHHYFSTLEEILKYIDGGSRPANLPADRYVSIFRALLTPAEAECLVMYALSSKGEGVKPFVARHELYKLLPPRNRLGLVEQIFNNVGL